MNVDPGPFELGDPDDDRPAVLCLHGLTGTPYEVRPPAEALAAAGFYCVGPLLPGHGTTPEELATIGRERWLETARDAYDRLAVRHPRVYLVGMSMGGLLALSLCLERQPAAAVLLATPLRLRCSARALVPLLHRLIRSIPKTPSIRDPEARRRHPTYKRMPLPAVRQLMRLQSEVLPQLSRIEIPVQLIYSRQDPTALIRDLNRLESGLGSASIETLVLEECEHLVTVDVQGDLVSARVVEFLSGLEEKCKGG